VIAPKPLNKLLDTTASATGAHPQDRAAPKMKKSKKSKWRVIFKHLSI